jgi:hypothetical protein
MHLVPWVGIHKLLTIVLRSYVTTTGGCLTCKDLTLNSKNCIVIRRSCHNRRKPVRRFWECQPCVFLRRERPRLGSSVQWQEWWIRVRGSEVWHPTPDPVTVPRRFVENRLTDRRFADLSVGRHSNDTIIWAKVYWFKSLCLRRPNVCRPNVCRPNVCRSNVCRPNVCRPNGYRPKDVVPPCDRSQWGNGWNLNLQLYKILRFLMSCLHWRTLC